MNTQNEIPGEGINVTDWLKKNNLTKLKPLFDDQHLKIEELCEFNHDELNAFIAEQKDAYKHQKLFDVLTQHRLKKGINNTRNKLSLSSAINTNNNKKRDNFGSNEHRIMVTPKEHNAIDKLYKRYETVSKLKQSIQQNAFKQLDECYNKLSQTEIESKFNEIINIIYKYKQELLDNIDVTIEIKKTALNKQLNTIEIYQNEVDIKREEFENMVYDDGNRSSPFKDIDLKQRYKYILKETDKILNCDKAQMVLVTQPNIRFSLQTNPMKQFLDEEFALNSCDQPVISSIKIVKIGFCFVRISFNWESSNVDQYEISFALTKKSTKSDHEQDVIHKKDKKQRKYKKAAMFGNNNDDFSWNQSSNVSFKNDNNNSFAFSFEDNNNNSSFFSFGDVKKDSNDAFSFGNNKGFNDSNSFSFAFGDNQQNKAIPFKFGIDENDKKKAKKERKQKKQSKIAKPNDNNNNKKNDYDTKSDEEGSFNITSKESKQKEMDNMDNIESISMDDDKWKSDRKNIREYNDSFEYNTLYNLKPHCSYLIKVRAANNCGWGLYSKCLSFTTKKEATAKKIELEYVECRGFYQRSSSYNGSMYYHPSNLLRNFPYNQQQGFYDEEEIDEEFMYASDRGYSFQPEEEDWIIFKAKKTKNRRYYVTQIEILGLGDQSMPKTFKLEIGDKRSLKLQEAVPDPDINRKCKKSRSISKKEMYYMQNQRNMNKQKSRKKKKKSKKKSKRKSKTISRKKTVSKKHTTKRKSTRNSKKSIVADSSSDDDEDESDSDDESSSDDSSDESSSDESLDESSNDDDDEKMDDKKSKKRKERKWISTKPKILSTELKYGHQAFKIKPKIMSDRKCNYFKISFLTNHGNNVPSKGCKFMLSKLNIWGIAIKD